MNGDTKEIITNYFLSSETDFEELADKIKNMAKTGAGQ